MNRATIKKLSEIYKMGHLPSRDGADYITTYNLANCFAHACINLSDEQYKQFEISEMNSREFGNFYGHSEESTSKQIIQTLSDAGLIVERCPIDKILKNNQWKVSLYFEFFHTISRDFHFLLQEKDGTWSGKVGYTRKCQIFNYVPKNIEAGKNFYVYFDTYCLTNPYASTCIYDKNKNIFLSKEFTK